MLVVIRAQLRRRLGRSLALLFGVLIAVSGFTVLTGTTNTSRLRAVGTIRSHFRSAYDILVRPKGSTTKLERKNGLVRPNFLSGIFGGITMDQYHKVRHLPGVQVAAPIAMVGYVLPRASVPLALGKLSTSDPRQVYRFGVTWSADRGLSQVKATNSYVYVTPHALQRSVSQDFATAATPRERLSAGRSVPVCPQSDDPATSPYTSGGLIHCWSARTGEGGLDRDGSSFGPSHFGYRLNWPMPFVLAAVDPAQEAALAGLDSAVTSGRYLSEGNRAPEQAVATVSPCSCRRGQAPIDPPT